jgi:hypothetical protein
MRNFILFLVLLIFLSGCGASKDLQARRGLMLLEPNEIPRNKPLKYSKKKTKKILHKKSKKKLKKR